MAARATARGPRIEIWDTGVGIAPAHQREIFREFYKVPGHAGTEDGFGLGLYIVARLHPHPGPSAGAGVAPGPGHGVPAAGDARPTARRPLQRAVSSLDQIRRGRVEASSAPAGRAGQAAVQAQA